MRATIAAALAFPVATTLAPQRAGARVVQQKAAGHVEVSNWTVYHGEPSGAGEATSSTPLSPLVPAWTSRRLDGDLYGEPLVEANRVFVATENDTVYALSARTGRLLWRTHLATPVPSGDLPCGDIVPTVGITGTPVIDPARQELFVVADEMHNGAPRHVLYGLDVSSGALRLRQRVDPPGSDPAAQLQRTGLDLVDGEVVFGYGGNDGDCSTYHGWIVAVRESGGPMRTFEVDARSGELRGAVWMGGAAPEVDAQGNIWAAVGNGSVSGPGGRYDGSDAVVELTPRLRLEQFFAPRDWRADNGLDLDLGSSAPALLGDGLVVQAGKSQTLYVLERADLGGIGGQRLSESGFCGNDVDGGDAVRGDTAYLPCLSGVEAVRTSLSPVALSVAWQAQSGAGGPPVLDGSRLYTVDWRSGTLDVLRVRTGRTLQRVALGRIATHFPVATAADGLLLASSTFSVHAFRGPDGLPPAPARSDAS